jgi:YesN/AraC family two-component response regulator
MRILIVDDEQENLRYLKETLEMQGYEIFAADNGKKGFDYFQQEKPDLVITDIQMPEMNGLELLQKIRKENSEVIVIMVTAFGSEQYALKALELKANNYLKKPFHNVELCNLVKKYDLAIKDKTREKDIPGFYLSKAFVMQFGNDIGLVSFVADPLMQETGDRIAGKERLGVHLGLVELIYNAIEHGNLAINYDETTKIVQEEGSTYSLIEERMKNPEYANRKVTIEFRMTDRYCQWIIHDQGDGFDWKSMPTFDRNNPLSLEHGRGIYLSKLQFDEMEYLGKGNIVRVRKNTA